MDVPRILPDEYINHEVFKTLDKLVSFYIELSQETVGWISLGMPSALSPDTYVFGSICGTVESIKHVALMGRLADAYTLLRKYHDATIVNVYVNQRLDVDFGIERLTVRDMNDWITGKRDMDGYRRMSVYLREKQPHLGQLMPHDGIYESIRRNCNRYAHHLSYSTVYFNDCTTYRSGKEKLLNELKTDVLHVFVQHFAYLFALRPHYMMASDYLDHKNSGIDPPKGSEYWVAPYVQTAFDILVVPTRPDVAEYIKGFTSMDLR